MGSRSVVNRTPRVYITNRGGHDFSPAERFGMLYYCSDGDLDKWDINQMYRQMSEALEDSEPEDYILLTSLTSLCSVACATFAARHGRLNLLIFKDGDYVARTLVFNKETNGQRNLTVRGEHFLAD